MSNCCMRRSAKFHIDSAVGFWAIANIREGALNAPPPVKRGLRSLSFPSPLSKVHEQMSTSDILFDVFLSRFLPLPAGASPLTEKNTTAGSASEHVPGNDFHNKINMSYHQLPKIDMSYQSSCYKSMQLYLYCYTNLLTQRFRGFQCPLTPMLGVFDEGCLVRAHALSDPLGLLVMRIETVRAQALSDPLGLLVVRIETVRAQALSDPLGLLVVRIETVLGWGRSGCCCGTVGGGRERVWIRSGISQRSCQHWMADGNLHRRSRTTFQLRCLKRCTYSSKLRGTVIDIRAATTKSGNFKNKT